MQVCPGPDGTTHRWARIPAGASAAAWAAIGDLGEAYAAKDPDLSLDQARADAFMDLLLTNVTATAKLTLGIPVLTGPDADTARDAAIAERAAENPPSAEDDPRVAGQRPVVATGGLGLGGKFSLSAALLSGCEIPGIGVIDPDTIEALMSVVPTDIARALLDARTGTLIETLSTAYRPPKNLTDFVVTRDGTCRMWGCPRPATTCDLDHARPWPTGPTTPTNLAGLCRRHHRLKQHRRWAYHLAPDGTATWTSPTGTTRTTPPAHSAPPPPPQRTPRPEPAARPARELVDVGPPPF